MILQRVIPPKMANIYHDNQSIKMLLSKLPEGLRGHVVGAVQKTDELVILADSAAWAARLRMAVADLPELAGNLRISVRLVPAGARDR